MIHQAYLEDHPVKSFLSYTKVNFMYHSLRLEEVEDATVRQDFNLYLFPFGFPWPGAILLHFRMFTEDVVLHSPNSAKTQVSQRRIAICAVLRIKVCVGLLVIHCSFSAHILYRFFMLIREHFAAFWYESNGAHNNVSTHLHHMVRLTIHGGNITRIVKGF